MSDEKQELFDNLRRKSSIIYDKFYERKISSFMVDIKNIPSDLKALSDAIALVDLALDFIDRGFHVDDFQLLIDTDGIMQNTLTVRLNS